MSRRVNPTLSSMLVAVIAAATICKGQSPPKKLVQKTPVAQSAFACPDAEAKPACRSYQELLKAKDKSLPDSDAYICFRKNVDQFFVLGLGTPYFPKHWDEDSKRMVSDSTPIEGFGYAQTYKDGVLDTATIPSFSFSGQWRWLQSFSESPYFTSTEFNFESQDQSDTGVSIRATQVSVEFKYKNKLDKTIRYSLAIQRSTGRFAESFRVEEEKIPFSENTGYCVYR
jgi:hypothetical protein